jgi:hypothetical protein
LVKFFTVKGGVIKVAVGYMNFKSEFSAAAKIHTNEFAIFKGAISEGGVCNMGIAEVTLLKYTINKYMMRYARKAAIGKCAGLPFFVVWV